MTCVDCAATRCVPVWLRRHLAMYCVMTCFCTADPWPLPVIKCWACWDRALWQSIVDRCQGHKPKIAPPAPQPRICAANLGLCAQDSERQPPPPRTCVSIHEQCACCKGPDDRATRYSQHLLRKRALLILWTRPLAPSAAPHPLASSTIRLPARPCLTVQSNPVLHDRLTHH